MSAIAKRVLFLTVAALMAVSISSCFGPFYTTLATYFKTERNKDYNVEFVDYKINVIVAAIERDNREPLENFGISLRAKSNHKYDIKKSKSIDTVNAIRIEHLCIYTFSNDSTQCPGLFKDTLYSIFLESNHIIQKPRWGGFNPVFIPVDNDSIKISFTAIMYDDNTYSKILDKKEFSSVLYRKYRKAIPLTR